MQFLEMYHQHSCPILKLKAHAPIYDEGYSLVCKVGLAMDSKVKASNLTERFLALKIVEIEGRSSNTRGNCHTVYIESMEFGPRTGNVIPLICTSSWQCR